MAARPPTLSALLRDLGADELREVIGELCKLNPQNRTFVELYLRASDEVDTGALLDALTGRLRACFLTRGDRPRRRPELADARRLVVEHERLAAEHPGVAAEGALRYVEAAAAYAAAARARNLFVQTATADAAVRMFERFVRAALARPAVAARLLPRAEALAGLDFRLHRLLAALRSGEPTSLDPPPADAEAGGYRVEYDRLTRRDDSFDA